jgi:glycosyltransferase involved in cell wall biosynthesis
MKKNIKMVHIAVLLMVKNEKKRLHVSLNSIEKFADSLVIFDTGSTDNTIEICREFSERTKIPLRLKEGTFVNFSVSRNESLDFADTFDDIDFLLLLDVNDELRNGTQLRKCAEEYIDNKSTGFLLCQEWFSGSYDKYFNVRFIKAHQKWRYVGSVHEYIKTFDEENDKHPIVKLPDSIVLYQDRTQDDDKSGKRFHRDKELLYTDYKKDPTEPRTVFYLAQTCSCLNQIDEALFYYKIRTTLDGFQEEKFHSLLRSGELSQKLGHDWYDSFVWYMKAYEHSQRVEPLLFISIYYINIKNWILAYTFLKLACNLFYPKEAILFVNKNDYDYKRWHLMGIVAYYVGQYIDGKNACIIALEYCKVSGDPRINTDLDNKNLQFYLEKEREIGERNPTNLDQQIRQRQQQRQQEQHDTTTTKIITRKQFVDEKMIEIQKEHPNLTPKQIHTRANMLWKNKQQK